MTALSSSFSKLLLNKLVVTKCFARNKVKYPKSNMRWPGGKQYYGFTYYPRSSEEKDPPVEPSKLLMIQRVKKYAGNPYWDKEILTKLKLDNNMSDIAIVENSAHMNAQLWKIKHLIKVTPITFPDGEPKGDDYRYSYINEFGEFRIHKNLQADPERLKICEERMSDNTKLDKQTVNDRCRERWLTAYNWTQVE